MEECRESDGNKFIEIEKSEEAMNLHYNPDRIKYKPILISIWGDYSDPFFSTREKWFEKYIHTPIGVAYFNEEGIHNVFNESIQYCMDQKIKFMILVNQSLAPRGDWSLLFRGMNIQRHAFIYSDNEMSFTVINVNKVRKYGYYRVIGSPKELHKWLVAKASSEGHNYRQLNDNEMKYIGAANEEPEQQSTRNKKQKYSRNKKCKKMFGSTEKKRQKTTSDE